MKPILLSIIIPVYNVENYIRKCLDSLIQCIDSDETEIICIDDGSTDRSGEICDDYQNKNINIKTIHQKNKGVASARNTGICYAKGQYIAWVDSDDYVSPNWFKVIKKYIEKNPDLLIFDYTLEKNRRYIKWHVGLSQVPTNEEFIYALSCDKHVTSILMNKVIHRKFFSKITFNEADIVLEDYRFLTYIAPDLKNIIYIPQSLYFYVQRKDSLVHQVSLRKSSISAKIAYNRYLYFSHLGYRVSASGYITMYLNFCFLPNASKSPYEKTYKKYYGGLSDHFLLLLTRPYFSYGQKARLILLKVFPQPFCIWLWNYLFKIKKTLVH